MTYIPKFGDVVDTTNPASTEQVERRLHGFSDISYSGSPTLYTAGDVVHVPYDSTEISTIEAIGLAWAAYASGVLPSG